MPDLESKTIRELLDTAFLALPLSQTGDETVTAARAALLEIQTRLGRYGLQRLKAKAVRCSTCGTDITLEALWREARECERCRPPVDVPRRRRPARPRARA